MADEPGIDHAFTATDDYGIRFEHAYSGAVSFLRRRYTKDLAGIDVAVTGIPVMDEIIAALTQPLHDGERRGGLGLDP